jgi:hypothetical protein
VNDKDNVVVFIEFLDGKPFALVTADDHRYDVDYDVHDDLSQYHLCGFGKCYPICYLEHSDHEYWAAPGIVVTKNDGDPAPPENRIECPVIYRDSAYHQWPNMFER